MGDIKQAIKVEGDDLQLLRDLMQIRKDADAFQAKLNEEFQQRAAEADATFEERHKTLWAQVYERYGLDPEGNFTIDSAYIDQLGIGFVVETAGCSCGADHGADNPLAALLGRALGGRVEILGSDDLEPEPAPERVLN